MTAPVKVPANLPELVRTTFHRACASGDVHFFPTQVALINVNSIPFQLRFSPALANKPKAPQPPAPSTDRHHGPDKDQQQPSKPAFFDPFDDPPPAMLVAPLPPSHILVLNKFAIVPEHCILATRAFKPQTHLLDAADLRAAYACIDAYHAYYHCHRCSSTCSSPSSAHPSPAPGVRPVPNTADDNLAGAPFPARAREAAAAAAAAAPPYDKPASSSSLFVFYNSGPASGSSQPHRHLQLLPVARMRDGFSPAESAAWAVLAERLVASSSSSHSFPSLSSASASAEGFEPPSSVQARVPFQTFAARIGPGADLRRVYLGLYRRAVVAVRGSAAALGLGRGAVEMDGEGEGEGEEARICYNLGMTRNVMVIAPRVAEGGEVTRVGGGDGGVGRRAVGQLALNGTVLAGTALVKTQAEWDALWAEPEQLLEIMGKIGVPSVQTPWLV